MKKKAIEKIPYFGLKKTSRKKDVKYIGVTAVKIVGHEKHLFLEVYRNKKPDEKNMQSWLNTWLMKLKTGTLTETIQTAAIA